jgi:hypothetical protein
MKHFYLDFLEFINVSKDIFRIKCPLKSTYVMHVTFLSRGKFSLRVYCRMDSKYLELCPPQIDQRVKRSV